MSKVQKVVWSEGMFLRPQHFQRQDKYFESSIKKNSQSICAYDWGFTKLEINKQALMQGRISIDHASGLMPDGTLFDTDNNQAILPPLLIDANTSNSIVFLSVPLQVAGVAEIAYERAQDFHRYHVIDEKIADSTSSGLSNEIQLAQLQMQLTVKDKLNGSFTYLPVARIIECRPDGEIILDDKFIPTVLHAQRSNEIKVILNEVFGLLGQRAIILSERLIQSDIDNHVGLVEYLMLQTVNRYTHLIYNFCQSNRDHPLKIYETLAMLAGDLSIFTTDKVNFKPVQYIHDRLEDSFYPLLTYIRKALLTVIDQKAIQIPFKDEKYGVKVAVINDKNLLTQAQFIISIYADMPAENLRRLFLTQSKFSPIDKISDLVNLQLPGLILSPLGAAPRQIPYSANRHYFELDTSSDLWNQMKNTSSLAVHIAGDFPGLKMECWALRAQ